MAAVGETRADVQHLLEELGLPKGMEYVEVRESERCAAARAALIPSRPPASLGPPPPTPAAPAIWATRGGQARLAVPVLTVVSPVAGVGRATLVGNLVHALGEHELGTVVVFDLDPASPLARFDTAHRAAGIATAGQRFVSGSDLAARLCGDTSAAGMAHTLEQLRAADPDWLRAPLAAFASAGAAMAIVAPSAGDGPTLASAARAADRVLAVASPAVSPSEVAAFDALVVRYGAPSPTWIVSRFDARQTSHREHLAALRGELGARALRLVIHEDPGVARLGVQGRPLALEASDSQVFAEIGALAEWTRATLEECGHGHRQQQQQQR